MTNLFQIFSDTAKEAPLWPQPFCIYNNPETKCTWLFGLLTVSCREPITYDNSDFVAGTQGGHVCTWWSKTKPYSGDSVVVVRSSGMTYTHPSPFLCVYINKISIDRDIHCIICHGDECIIVRSNSLGMEG